jgi:hypothetical protein
MVDALGWVLIVLGVAALAVGLLWGVWLIVVKGVWAFQIRGIDLLSVAGLGLLITGLVGPPGFCGDCFGWFPLFN